MQVIDGYWLIGKFLYAPVNYKAFIYGNYTYEQVFWHFYWRKE